MSNALIFAIGCGVFGISLAATMVMAIPPSRQDVRKRARAEDPESDNPTYVP